MCTYILRLPAVLDGPGGSVDIVSEVSVLGNSVGVGELGSGASESDLRIILFMNL